MEPGVGLGHRRLSIIDLSTGQQPLYNEDGGGAWSSTARSTTTRSSIPELDGAAAIVFHTRSDTEVIVHAWEAWGEECVTRFRGMFAFALWDRNRADAVPGARPARREAAVLCLAARWPPALRLRAQVAARAPRPGARDRPVRGRGVFRAGLRCRAAHDLSGTPASCSAAHTLARRRGARDPPSRASTGTCGSPSIGSSSEAEACDELASSGCGSRCGCA